MTSTHYKDMGTGSAYFTKNRFVVLFLVCFVFGLSLYANSAYFFNSPEYWRYYPPFQENVHRRHNTHLGEEYYNIAEAIASGKGFSNPFALDTGPTAWMPPLYPYFLALLITLFKLKPLVACCIVLLKNLVLVMSGLMVYEIAKKTFLKLHPEFFLVFYCALILISFRWFFQITHDAWLLLLFMCIIYLLGVSINNTTIRLKTAITWGVVGGLSSLTNPVMGLVWLVLCLFNMCKKHNRRLLIVSYVLFFIICTPWFIRNYIVFNKIIFIKSNLFHDLYSQNYETASGHPDEMWTRAKQKTRAVRHAELGELNFIGIDKERFMNAIKNNPEKFIQNIKDRVLSAFVIYVPHNREYENITITKSVIHALPLIAILFLLMSKGYTRSGYILIALVVYAIFLLPYVLVSYYVRYVMPLIPLKVLFCFWSLDGIINQLTSSSSDRLPEK